MSFITPAVIFVESQSTMLLALLGLGTAPVALQLTVLVLLGLATATVAGVIVYGIASLFRSDNDGFGGPGADPVDYSKVPVGVGYGGYEQQYQPYEAPSVFAPVGAAVAAVAEVFTPAENPDPVPFAEQLKVWREQNRAAGLII